MLSHARRPSPDAYLKTNGMKRHLPNEMMGTGPRERVTRPWLRHRGE
jgi:hypothetical protein